MEAGEPGSGQSACVASPQPKAADCLRMARQLLLAYTGSGGSSGEGGEGEGEEEVVGGNWIRGGRGAVEALWRYCALLSVVSLLLLGDFKTIPTALKDMVLLLSFSLSSKP